MLCPRCGAAVTPPTCAACGLDLTDPRAVRLGEINREYAELMAERGELLADLDGRVPTAPGSPPSATDPGVRGASGPSGQHILLTVGALLLLGAGSVFVLAVWFLVGRYGQIALLLAAVGAGIAMSFVLAKRRLTASAETAAALAVGFVLISASAAHAWDLLGLRAIPIGWYAGVGLAILGALGAVAHLISRREPAPIRAYAWAAAGGFAVSAAIAAARALAVTSAEPGRYVAAVGLVLYAIAAVRLLPRWPDLRAEVTAGVGWGGAVLIAVASFVPLSDVPYQALAVLSAVVSGVVAAGVLRMTTLTVGRRPAAALIAAYLPYLYLLLMPLWQRGVVGSGSVRSTALENGPFTPLPLWAPTVAAVALAVPAAAAVIRFRTRPTYGAAAAVALEVLGSLALSNGLARSSSRTWASVAVAYVAVQAVLVIWARRRNATAPIHWTAVETAAGAAAGVGAFVALAAAVDVDHYWVVGVLATLALLACGVAVLPERRGLAYLAGVLATGAWWVYLDGRGNVEAYVLPSAVVLFAAGAGIWVGARTRSSLVTVAPGLAMAVVPPTLVGIIDGDPVRLTVTTVVAAALVAGGVTSRLMAPVAVGSFVVAIVVVTQGGPYVAAVPYWITGGILGIALVAGGIAWERTTAFGRRSIAWFTTLR